MKGRLKKKVKTMSKSEGYTQYFCSTLSLLAVKLYCTSKVLTFVTKTNVTMTAVTCSESGEKSVNSHSD